MPDPIFDPLLGPKWILDGRIVPMVTPGDDIADGRIYGEGGRIIAVQAARAKRPAGFSKVKVLKTGGTIFPGMIELHNHLSYNALPLWNVPKKYDNRGQWGSHSDYRKLVSGPMSVLGKTDGLIQAVVRWVETKSLVAGVTTSQGVKLFSNSGAQRYYKGLIRNVEQTDDPALPEGEGKIGDVAAKQSKKFLKDLERFAETGRKKILHLAEGVDDRANDHFRALKINSRDWAINEALIGIHATGLRGRNFATMRSRGGSIVWSPLSNLLLYGGTTDVARAVKEGLPVSLGSDWSPSGSKNLLMELKAAKAWSDLQGIGLTDFDVVSMATRVPAEMMGWHAELGTIQKGMRADFVVIDNKAADPCARLIDARESSVVLVMVNGVRRYGQPRLMKDAGLLENRLVAGVGRSFHLTQEHVDPVVGGLSVAAAEERLTFALGHLSELAKDLEQGTSATLDLASGSMEINLGTGAALGDEPGRWFLDLEEDDFGPGLDRHQLPVDGHRTGLIGLSQAASVPLSELLHPIELDPLTAVEDASFWRTIAVERNLPPEIKAVLFDRYRRDRLEFTAGGTESGSEVAEFAEPQPLSLDDRRLIVAQAVLLLEQAYVHLPFKRSLHAVDPIQRLRLLDYRISQQKEGDESAIRFHRQMIDVFTSLRDLHTTYVVPAPYRAAVFMLPFRVEECFDDSESADRRQIFVASSVDLFSTPETTGNADSVNFVEQVEITHWNGVPIRRAIELLGERQAAGNYPAAFSRALDALTLRPMLSSMVPDEDWVDVRYVGMDGVPREIRFVWESRNAPKELLDDRFDAAMGIDAQTHAVGAVRKDMYAYASGKWSRAGERRGELKTAVALSDHHLETHMPWVFRAHPTRDEKFGYIRIFTFSTPKPHEFIAEFARLAASLPEKGLIIDVRGNAGGSIVAAEGLLQVLTEEPVDAERAQFTTSPLMLDICRGHSPSKKYRDLDLSHWVKSLAQAVATGSSYSQGFPITPEDALTASVPHYPGSVVLIVDALCYSATDMFAAGFLDHGIGKVVGIADNTGAGGANVWRHSDLLQLAGKGTALEALPGAIDMRVAVRRTTRVRGQEGEILEDLGIIPDIRHYMTRQDVFEGNRDLIAKAAKALA